MDAGHVPNGSQKGSLYRLGALKPGAMVYTRSGTRKVRAWRVTSVKTHPKRNGLPRRVFDRDGVHRLAIVTCGGRVLPNGSGGRHYGANVVAYAVPV
ncbi:MAG: class F sortase [Nocardioides sp.]